MIAGWDQGVQGMKVGGRRQLIIPPDLAYGDRGAGNAIAPGETLIFVCDLVSVWKLRRPGRLLPSAAVACSRPGLTPSGA